MLRANMPNIEHRKFNPTTSIRSPEAEAARERMIEIFDSVHPRNTPEDERQYYFDIRELYELAQDFPDVYRSLFFLRSVRYLRRHRVR